MFHTQIMIPVADCFVDVEFGRLPFFYYMINFVAGIDILLLLTI